MITHDEVTKILLDYGFKPHLNTGCHFICKGENIKTFPQFEGYVYVDLFDNSTSISIHYLDEENSITDIEDIAQRYVVETEQELRFLIEKSDRFKLFFLIDVLKKQDNETNKR